MLELARSEPCPRSPYGDLGSSQGEASLPVDPSGRLPPARISETTMEYFAAAHPAAASDSKPPARRRGRSISSELRQHSMHVKLTAAEFDEIERRAITAGMARGTYLRELALCQPIVNGEELARLRQELARIGSNINQIAKAANAGRIPNLSAAEIDTLAALVREAIAATRRNRE